MKLNSSVFEVFPVLKTERLTLRRITLNDAQQIFEMRSNSRVGTWIARPVMKEEEAAEMLAQKTMEAFDNQQGIGWAAELRDEKTMIGSCGFNSIDPWNLRAEIGGELDVNYWGKGIAEEAVRAIVDFGFNTFGLHSIEAKVDPTNRGAIYLMEQIGFKKEALFKDRIYFDGTFRDMAVYSAFAGN